MHLIKVFVTGILIMMGFLGIFTLFLPSKVTVSKTILINAPGAEVAAEIDSFENWKHWYPAFQNPNIARTILQKGDSSLVTLTDEKQRKFSMTMIRSGRENIDILLLGNDKNNVTWQFILSSNGPDQTQLTWNVNTTLPWYPWKKITGIFLDKITGPQYEEALQNLKIAVEMHQNDSPK